MIDLRIYRIILIFADNIWIKLKIFHLQKHWTWCYKMKSTVQNIDSVKKLIQVPKFPSINWMLCVCIWMIVFISCNECVTLKRSASPDFNAENSESSLDKLNVNYDEYPVSSWQSKWSKYWKGVLIQILCRKCMDSTKLKSLTYSLGHN